MAADTAKKTNLALHLPKIAYGVAGLLGVIVLFVPLFTTSGLTQLRRDLEGEQKNVETRLGEERSPLPVPDVEKTLQAQWSVSNSPQGGWIPAWSVDARPSVVHVAAIAELVDGKHLPGKVAKILFQRDAQKRVPFLRVEAQAGENLRVKMTRALLLRSEGEGGAFTQVAAFAKEPYVYNDYAVAPGKTYAYQLVTEAESTDPIKIKFKDEDKQQTSAPLSTAGKPIPWDYALRILSVVPFDAATNAPASFNGDAMYWDYAAGKVVTRSKVNWAEQEPFGPKVGAVDRYKIAQIDGSGVTVMDQSDPKLTKEQLTVKLNKRPVALPEAVVEGQQAAATTDLDDAKAAAGKAKKASADDADEKPAPKKKPGTKDKSKKGAAAKKKATTKK